MGLGNTTDNHRKFVTIVGGKWVLAVPEGTEGAVERVNKLGKTVHELQFTYVDGTLREGRMKIGQFGTTLELDLEDEGQVYVVQIPVPSDYFSAFGKCCENIDPTKKLFLGLGFDKDRGHPFLYIKQDGSAHTKDEPNGLPPWEKKTVMGKVTWDHEAQDNFLYEKVVEFLSVADDEKSTDIPF
jgi:hypothetical protein